MPILLKTSKQSGGRAPTISDNPTVDWQHPVNEGLYTWWPMVNGIWHDLTGMFPERYPMEQMGAGAKITFDGNVYWNHSQAATSFAAHGPSNSERYLNWLGPITSMYSYKTSGTGSSMYPWAFRWTNGDSISVFTSHHTRPSFYYFAGWSGGGGIQLDNLDNFGRRDYNSSDRIVNVLATIDGGVSGSATITGYKDHSSSKTVTGQRRPDNSSQSQQYVRFDGNGPAGTRNPRAHLGIRLWQGELNESAIDTLLNDRWAGMWWKTKTIFLPKTTPPPSASTPIYLFHNRHHNRSA